MHPHNGANNISIIDYLFKHGAILDLSSYPFDNIEGDGQGDIKNYNIADLANMFYDPPISVLTLNQYGYGMVKIIGLIT